MIALMMEAVSTSETSVDIDLRTRQYIPEDSELHSLINFPSVKGFELDATKYHYAQFAFTVVSFTLLIH
jgi:hypothetical protein